LIYRFRWQRKLGQWKCSSFELGHKNHSKAKTIPIDKRLLAEAVEAGLAANQAASQIFELLEVGYLLRERLSILPK